MADGEVKEAGLGGAETDDWLGIRQRTGFCPRRRVDAKQQKIDIIYQNQAFP